MSDLEKTSQTDVAQGVRAGILAALAQDVERRGCRTARRLVSAGLLGVAGALGATLIVSTHPFGHHPHWHEIVFSTAWAGLLIVSLSLLFLGVQTPELPIARAAAVGLAGLGLAGLCCVWSPDPHVMGWWLTTSPGATIAERVSLGTSAYCFGFVTVFLLSFVPGVLLLRSSFSTASARRLTALFVTLLLLPGVSLASFGLSPAVLVGWLVGVASGSYVGVAAAIGLRAWLSRS